MGQEIRRDEPLKRDLNIDFLSFVLLRDEPPELPELEEEPPEELEVIEDDPRVV